MIHIRMSNVVPIRPIRWSKLRSDEAERVIRERAGKDAIIYSHHGGTERSEGRSIPRADIKRMLLEGYADEPKKDPDTGDWKVKLRRPKKRQREFGVIVAIPEEQPNVIVVTVEWED